MDIFNRPPAISEDTVQYRLYPTQKSADKVSVLTLATVLKCYADELLPGFLWHRDPFELKVVSDTNGWLLEGTMRVGDCVDDEWCVVWLLRQISEKWDIAIRSVLSYFVHLLHSNYSAACRTRTESSSSLRLLRSYRPGSHLPTSKTECAPVSDKIMRSCKCFNFFIDLDIQLQITPCTSLLYLSTLLQTYQETNVWSKPER